MLRPITRLAFVTALVIALPATAVDVSETTATVPELSALHDVIYPLWHTAWPERDVAMMRELLPEARQGVAAIEGAELPGILRDKRDAWNEGVAALRSALDAYAGALADGDDDGLFAAVEDFHARFEQLVRIVRPPMKEMDAFHVVLYDVWHHLVPEQRMAELDAPSAALVERCDALATATLPRRTAGQEPRFHAAIASLCTASRGFRDAVEAGDGAAVTRTAATLHDRYQALDHLFEQL